MMAGSKSPRARLLHIRDEIDGVAMIVRNLSFANTRAATCTAAQSNAPRRSFRKLRKRCRRITSPNPQCAMDSIVGIGNILRHEYQRLDDKQLWEIATVHLPKLQPIVMQMLAELDR